MSDYLKEKLYEALRLLVGASDLDKRLAYAATTLIGLQDHQIPKEFKEQFASIRARLNTTPHSSERSYVPRQISEKDGRKLAYDILDLYTQLWAASSGVASPLSPRGHVISVMDVTR
jgi:hypothetical protein